MTFGVSDARFGLGGVVGGNVHGLGDYASQFRADFGVVLSDADAYHHHREWIAEAGAYVGYERLPIAADILREGLSGGAFVALQSPEIGPTTLRLRARAAVGTSLNDRGSTQVNLEAALQACFYRKAQVCVGLAYGYSGNGSDGVHQTVGAVVDFTLGIRRASAGWHGLNLNDLE